MNNEKESLLKIYRNFTKDEVIGLRDQEIQKLKKELSVANFKKGELKSEVAELKHSLNEQTAARYEANKKDPNYLKIKIRFEKRLESRLKSKTNKLNIEIKKLKSDVKYWQEKYFNLKSNPK